MFIKIGAWTMIFVAIAIMCAGLHVWQESLREDGAWIWSCHTMGDNGCADGQPPVTFHWGGYDQ